MNEGDFLRREEFNVHVNSLHSSLSLHRKRNRSFRFEMKRKSSVFIEHGNAFIIFHPHRIRLFLFNSFAMFKVKMIVVKWFSVRFFEFSIKQRYLSFCWTSIWTRKNKARSLHESLLIRIIMFQSIWSMSQAMLRFRSVWMSKIDRSIIEESFASIQCHFRGDETIDHFSFNWKEEFSLDRQLKLKDGSTAYFVVRTSKTF